MSGGLYPDTHTHTHTHTHTVRLAAMSDYWHELASMTIAAAAAEAGGVIQSTSRMIDQ